MKVRALGLALILTAACAQAQRAPDPAPQHPLAVPAESSKHRDNLNEAELLSHRHYTQGWACGPFAGEVDKRPGASWRQREVPGWNVLVQSTP